MMDVCVADEVDKGAVWGKDWPPYWLALPCSGMVAIVPNLLYSLGTLGTAHRNGYALID